jgi:hypothetical protein
MSDEIDRELDEAAAQERALQAERDRLAKLGMRIDEAARELPRPIVIDHPTQGGVI